jgi:predicted RNA binding protein YcfA (HicA-like mRNA interferase family)
MKVSKIEASLAAKGFQKANSHHKFFIYYTKDDNKKTVIKTRTSHGHSEISVGLEKQMAKQCKLDLSDFRNLIECPLSREGYEEKVKEHL